MGVAIHFDGSAAERVFSLARTARLTLTMLALGTLACDWAAARPPGQFHNPAIQIVDDEWRNASRAEVEQVLVSTARELRVFFPERNDDTIYVRQSGHVPVVLYERGPRGEYTIQLTARGRFWPAYAYEFAHELCHVYANFERRPNSALAPHQWFEESLCEAASLFVLRRMAVTWREEPPNAHWRVHAPAFREYAELLMSEPHRHGNVALGPWFAKHAAMLAGDPYQRSANEYCANRLLELFEAQPQGWSSLQYLNTPTSASELNFNGYLRHWHGSAPAEQRPFLGKLLSLFGVGPEGQQKAATQ